MSTHHWDLTKVSRVPSHIYIEFQIGGGCVCWWGGAGIPGVYLYSSISKEPDALGSQSPWPGPRGPPVTVRGRSLVLFGP